MSVVGFGLALGASAQIPNLVRTGAVTSVNALTNGIEVHAGAAAMKVEALRDDVLRVRVTPDGVWQEDASWAVLPRAKAVPTAVTAASNDKSVGFATKEVRVTIDRATMQMRVTDLAGNVISEDAPGYPVEFKGPRDAQGGAFKLFKTMHFDEHYFGLGDKVGPLDRRGQSFVDWNTDSFNFQESTDPIYKSIPFFIGSTGGRYYGMFVDNTWRANFDFGRSERDVLAMGAEGGPLDYYLFYGPKPKKVVETYAWLTGTPSLPPLWSLGFQQSRFSYAPESVVHEVADRLRKDRIPADVLWLDIDWQDQHRPFTSDPVGFPNMKKLVSDLHQQGFQLVVICDLHVADVAKGYTPYTSGKAIDAFVKRPDGSDYVGKSWPGEVVFPNFTDAGVRKWFGTQYKAFVDDGIAGFWDDMNEPSIASEPNHTMPIDLVHSIAGDGFAPRKTTHREVHNIFGMQNARATYEGVQALAPNLRPYVMTRATYAGGQRYSVTWTGDNSATWNHLRFSSTMLLNLGLSGYAFAGADVGGFIGEAAPDLLTKWIEISAFQPIDRDHSNKEGGRQEPYVGTKEQEDIRRRFIETRYKLLPYNYTLAEETSRTGLPMMRPIFLEFPDASPDGRPADVNRTPTNEYFWGSSLVVAPEPYLEKVNQYRPLLPGEGWYDFWTGKRIAVPKGAAKAAMRDRAADGQVLPPDTKTGLITPRLDELPVFVRPGSIIPMQAVTQSTMETPAGPLEVHVYPGPAGGSACAGSLYSDDGVSTAYLRGDFARTQFTCAPGPGGLTVSIGAREGSFVPWWKEMEIVVHGWTSAAMKAKVEGGSMVSARYDAASETAHIVLAASPLAQTVRLSEK